jgi:predicted Zn-dependent protease
MWRALDFDDFGTKTHTTKAIQNKTKTIDARRTISVFVSVGKKELKRKEGLAAAKCVSRFKFFCACLHSS